MYIFQAEIIIQNQAFFYSGWLIVLLLVIVYLVQRRTISQLKALNQLLRDEKSQGDYWLSSILPSEVVRQLKNDKTASVKSYDNVCIMFVDFKGFSEIAEQLSPEELVEELNNYFSHFDQITSKYQLQKIKTIGDAYMCVSGLYTKGPKHIQRMIVAALEIQTYLKYLADQNDGHLFKARIGIHTGAIVAGVIGTDRMAFDVWGNAVNVAQQMEQHAEVDTVNISSTTYELVKTHFACTFRTAIELKNKKRYGMYRVDAAL